MAQTSSNVGMSAKEYAKKQLGDLETQNEIMLKIHITLQKIL